MKYLAQFLCFILSLSVAADEFKEQRSPWIGLHTIGGEKYLSTDLNGGLYLGDIWMLWLRANSTKSDTLTSGDLRFGADIEASERLKPKASVISRSEPGDIRGAGGTAGLDWNFPSPFNTEWTSIVFVDTEVIRYWQTAASRTALALSKDDILVQRSLTLGFAQELGPRWLVSLFITGYGYDQDPELWSDAVADRYWTARAVDVPVRGFPRSNSVLEVNWLALEWWSLSATITTNRGADNSKGDGAGVGTRFFVGSDWVFEGNVSSSRTEGVRDGGLLGIGAEYKF